MTSEALMTTGGKKTYFHRRLPWSLTAVVVFLFCGAAAADDFGTQLARAALARTRHRVTYDGSYFTMAYPNGDVPAHLGVCTDMVIRSYRLLGVDLQQAVHEDMTRHFAAYPSRRIWGLTRPDPNIDHRRVPNLQVFLTRNGEALPVSSRPEAYRAGDLVTWMLPGNLPHIGIVSDRRTANGERRLMVHNIGAGPRLEDVLFRFPITGHYRYRPEDAAGQIEAIPLRTTTPPSAGEAS
jgi:uncharacterized protein YijF (DUF1287 family)